MKSSLALLKIMKVSVKVFFLKIFYFLGVKKFQAAPTQQGLGTS